jgi:hypothetical protein
MLQRQASRALASRREAQPRAAVHAKRRMLHVPARAKRLVLPLVCARRTLAPKRVPSISAARSSPVRAARRTPLTVSSPVRASRRTPLTVSSPVRAKQLSRVPGNTSS